MADIHRSAQHGDLHPGNFEFDAMSSEKIVVFDHSRTKYFGRPLTAEERAEDLLKLRMNVADREWIWFRMAYSARAPEYATEALALVEQRRAALNAQRAGIRPSGPSESTQNS